jgi:hypothetical protein
MAQFDAKQVHTNDWGVMGGGLLVLISSFLAWYGYDSKSSFGHFSASIGGWSAGFFAWFGILLCIAAAVIVALRVFSGPSINLPVTPALLALGLSGLAVLLFLLRWLTLPSGSGGGFGSSFKYGARIGLFLALIGAIAQAVFAFLAFRASGEKMAFGNTGGAAPPAPGGYDAPPPPPPPAG